MKLSQVLLVEDNAGDALLVGQALAGCPMRVRLHIARDGEQALQILEEPDFKALYPPKKNQTPVVVFTPSENETEVSRAFSLGAKEFVHKPWNWMSTRLPYAAWSRSGPAGCSSPKP